MEGSESHAHDKTLPPKNKSKKFWVTVVLTTVFLALVGAVLGFFFWYNTSLQPVNQENSKIVRFKINSGEGNRQIAYRLEEAKLIKSSSAMILYVKLRNEPTTLQAGTYALSQSYGTKQIVSHLERGNTDVMKVTILPGKTIEEIQTRLQQRYGYSKDEVEKALADSYTHPLLADKPSFADLEGYIYPETFEVVTGDDVSKLFKRSFDTLYDKITQEKLQDEFKKRSLGLYQAITLASIVQMEASDPQDQKQIAQVLLKRLSIGMKLESDPTFVYAAKKLGVEPSVAIDSPYNTRKNLGLPPGPISNMNFSALKAVAYPARGEYLYFVAGDDGNTYFAMTLEEHEQNVEKYCKKLCKMF